MTDSGKTLRYWKQRGTAYQRTLRPQTHARAGLASVIGESLILFTPQLKGSRGFRTMFYGAILWADDQLLSWPASIKKKTQTRVGSAFPNACDLIMYWLETQQDGQEKGKGSCYLCLPFKYLKYFCRASLLDFLLHIC